MKWFEKKWVVNSKIRARLNMSFLFIAVIAVLVNACTFYFITIANMPHSPALTIILGASSVLLILIALLLAYINAFLILDPSLKNQRILDRVSVGDLDLSTVFRQRDGITLQYKDEIGSLSRSFAVLLEYLLDISASVEKIAAGDLSVESTSHSEKDIIGNNLKDLVDHFHRLVSCIVSTIDQISSGARLVSDSSLALSQGATVQASSVQELTASLEQLAQQTHLNAQNAQTANEFAQRAKQNASGGNENMKDMLCAMEAINQSSNNIRKIIKVIDDIAFQTNILALNAAVEAARAGQYGKGFAVVAEEVRNLASKSADAARETTDLIQRSIQEVDAGTKIATQTATSLSEIVSQVDKAATLIDSIATASTEQSYGIDQIRQGISLVSQVIQTNAATADSSASASEQLSSQVETLKDQASLFKLRSRTRTANTSVYDRQTTPHPVSELHKVNLSQGDLGKY